MPPANDVVVARIDDWPESIALGLTEITGADRGALTVTLTALDVTVAGDPELSVTLSSNDQAPVVVRAAVCKVVGEVQAEAVPKLE